MEDNVQITERKEGNVLTEKFVFKDEINQRLDDEKRRCIRSILYVLEMLMEKDSDEYTKARKSVLDFVNDYNRSVSKIFEKVV